LDVDADAGTCVVEPGIVLDALNRKLAAHGLWYPIDVSTGSRATIGGMTGNNSCGTRSLRYGIMRDRVLEVAGLHADGSAFTYRQPDRGEKRDAAAAAAFEEGAFAATLREIGSANAALISQAFPEVSRRVGGYNIDALVPEHGAPDLAALMCGSEGTLALSERLTLRLAPKPKRKALGVCHFPTFRAAMEAAQHIVKLGPVAVEVVDRTLIELSRDIPMFAETMKRFVIGAPDALLLTEFAEDDAAENLRRLSALEELMGDLGYPGSVFRTDDAALQADIWEVRKAGLNIMMSMKDDRKPVSFIEDCAVPLPHLADYTSRLTEVFEKHGTRGTWYAHASVGCLHVRPVLNLKLDQDARTMRSIAEEAFALVREYKGAHSGEHGDGLVRSEFHREMYGDDVVDVFEEVKRALDPSEMLNPGKIVDPPRMNDRTLFRYHPAYTASAHTPALDWSSFADASHMPGAAGFQNAVEMCNNNGACRKHTGGVMCPSYRVTRDEQDVVRGRANTLRLALSGQLDADALTSDAMAETMSLCVSCKACRSECPTGVDMARMKIEVLAARAAAGKLSVRDRLVAYLPRYAPYLARAPWLSALRERLPGAAALFEKVGGIARDRALPRWKSRTAHKELAAHRQPEAGTQSADRRLADTRPVVYFFQDTFNRYFAGDPSGDARAVLTALGYEVRSFSPVSGSRPLCCGRTFLAAGLVEEARAEAERVMAAFVDLESNEEPFAIVGLEPSCMLTLRDEFRSLGLGADAERIADRAKLFEEFIAEEIDAERIGGSALGELKAKVHVHGHCHQKSFKAFAPMTRVLAAIDGLEVHPIDSSCCGMAGAFGYARETADVSRRMGEVSLMPAVRAAEPDDWIVADGFSCRHQIEDGAGRRAHHAASVLAAALGVGSTT
ncbi:MAG: FAD-linked oxidase C-terminal domain-containing protein, partial [Pseudomonadota bacterium]